MSSQLCTYHQYRRHQHPLCHHSYQNRSMYLPSIQKTPASSMHQLCTYHQYRRHQPSQLCTYHQYRRHQHPLCHHSYVLTINTEDTSIHLYLPSMSSQLCTYHQYRRHQHPLCHHSYVLTINTEDTSILHAISYVLTINTEDTSILQKTVSSQLCTYHQYRRHQHPPSDHSYVLTINTEDTSILCVITVMYLPSIQKTPASSE